MVVKIYISGISGNKEVKKRQQRVLMILDSKNIKYEVIDITEPGREADKDFMQNNAKSLGGTVSDPSPRSPLPPQMFNDEEYCGDYDQFDLANEVDTLEQFLKVEVPPEQPLQAETEEKTLNGEVNGEKSKETSQERDTTDESKLEETGKDSPSTEGSPTKEGSVAREDGTISKEASPEKDNVESTNEKSEEATSERQKSVEKETTEKERSPVTDNVSEKEEQVNENGAVSSREQSEEKEAGDEQIDNVERKKENPSELLIESEQAAAE
ncbi:SH3 domain-binding glutamic acid-rich protein homolog [Manduca sexta]|uniref:SH3 domain-binding glutamic acid-rich protein homolog n=1 Tax=Manduca sexta TaxID=7130 RepID=A0A922CNB6_MANSE|nr:SH3 domain-binding glutamic acid-rich protein homolog [Manduca sexta]KAG6452254.1 hypothetical protein O3G_MSEX007547 [Manduca sexta]